MTTPDVFALTGRQENASPVQPIEKAPRVIDAPLLLWDRDDKEWFVGHWDGEYWCTADGFVVAPIAWAPLPPAPVITGRQDDAELIRAARRWDELTHRLQQIPHDDAAEPLIDEKGRLMETITNAEPSSLAGCILKLRVLADPDYGMEAGERDDDVISLRQVLAFLENLVGEAS